MSAPYSTDDCQYHTTETHPDEAPDAGRSGGRAAEDMRYLPQEYHQNTTHKSCLKTFCELLQQQESPRYMNQQEIRARESGMSETPSRLVTLLFYLIFIFNFLFIIRVLPFLL